MVFFTDSNGGNDSTPANPLSSHYAPLQQFLTDLQNNTVADYNWITPNQYNDMHSTLTGGYKGLAGDAANIKQGDDFLSQIVPVIMASDAYKNHGVIILWWDESERDGLAGDNPDDLNHTVARIVISKRAHENVNGLPYASPIASRTPPMFGPCRTSSTPALTWPTRPMPTTSPTSSNPAPYRRSHEQFFPYASQSISPTPAQGSPLLRRIISTNNRSVHLQVDTLHFQKDFPVEGKKWSGRKDLNLRPPGPEPGKPIT